MSSIKSTFSFDQTTHSSAKPSTEEVQARFRESANQMAVRFFQAMPIANDENQYPKTRSMVSKKDLEKLLEKATYYPELRPFFPAMQGLMDTFKRILDKTDFSNGYEEEERNRADLEKIEGLFGTYLTIHQTYIDKCENLKEVNPFAISAFAEWYNAVMGNLSLEILQEVAKNNLESRRGQLISLDQSYETYSPKEYHTLRNHILTSIGALDPNQNPEGWADAALMDLKKFLALPEGAKILHDSLALLNEYSH